MDSVAVELLGLRVVVALGQVGSVSLRQIHFRWGWWLNSMRMDADIDLLFGAY